VNWPAVTAAITASTAVGALVFTALSLGTTRDQVASAEQGQFTDRYTKAVEELDKAGADHLQARLGALYSLERLAHDSPRDQPTIIEIVSAFVRTTAPPVTSRRRCPAGEPGADIQAALTVLGRRDPAHDDRARVSLYGTCLVGANLAGANLAGANLSQVVLDEATLLGANLSKASIFRASFEHSILANANLREATGESVNFTFATLEKADLTGASLYGADFTIATLSGANLSGTMFYDARYKNTDTTDVITDAGTQGKWW